MKQPGQIPREADWDEARRLVEGALRIEATLEDCDPLEATQIAVAVHANNTSLGDPVDLSPVGAQPLDDLHAVVEEAAALELELGKRPTRANSEEEGVSCRG